ncbi:hypothetical protein, partial [Halopseudomonas salina]|uniref:hypothetical protein n=1 Tax=Halopseudomonas salina TaxID=1323744 RepID=UPI001E2CB924
SCKLQAASCKLQAASCKLQAASCKLQANQCGGWGGIGVKGFLLEAGRVLAMVPMTLIVGAHTPSHTREGGYPF